MKIFLNYSRANRELSIEKQTEENFRFIDEMKIFALRRNDGILKPL
jgi:hypothetical protein